MSKHTCCGSVSVAGLAFYRSRICGCKAKFEHEGKHYCGNHYPPAVKARQDKSMDEFRQKIAFQNSIREAPFVKIKQLTEQRDELLGALKLCALVCAGETTSKSELIYALERASAAISKVKGEKL